MDDMTQLTSRQAAILEFIRTSTAERGYAPTVREIGQQFGIRSPNGVTCHLKALKSKGYMSSEPGASRTYTVCGVERPTLTITDVVAACEQECDSGFTGHWQLGWNAAMYAVRTKLGINKDGAGEKESCQ